MKALRVLSLGWGVQSWTLAAMAALGELEPIDYAIHADTTHEAAKTFAHAKKWTPWLEERGVNVITVRANRPDVVREDWGESGSVLIPAFTTDTMTGSQGQVRRQCTHDWKIMPIRRFIRTKVSLRPGAVESIQGISLDEWSRMRTSDVKYIENAYPLVDRRLTRAACVAWLQEHDLDVPPKSACTFCPFRSLESWRILKRAGDSDWAEAVAVDRAIRSRRANQGYILYVHPARRPLAEAVSIPEDVGAEQLAFEMPCDGGACWV